tara:strand:- start:60 stop:530 length:471 start_codon:yes stop_codon:yes gene_type:complete
LTDEFVEIERKFLTHPNFPRSDQFIDVKQGYLSQANETELRIRVETNRALLTKKTRLDHISAHELSSEINHELGMALLELCDADRIIYKRRFFVEIGELTWEIDEFFNRNSGLIIAEVELGSVEQAVDLPEWLDREITTEPMYRNSSLYHHPLDLT